jgi:hypothetical protein
MRVDPELTRLLLAGGGLEHEEKVGRYLWYVGQRQTLNGDCDGGVHESTSFDEVFFRLRRP